jgi:hypothetical protein
MFIKALFALLLRETSTSSKPPRKSLVPGEDTPPAAQDRLHLPCRVVEDGQPNGHHVACDAVARLRRMVAVARLDAIFVDDIDGFYVVDQLQASISPCTVAEVFAWNGLDDVKSLSELLRRPVGSLRKRAEGDGAKGHVHFHEETLLTNLLRCREVEVAPEVVAVVAVLALSQAHDVIEVLECEGLGDACLDHGEEGRWRVLQSVLILFHAGDELVGEAADLEEVEGRLDVEFLEDGAEELVRENFQCTKPRDRAIRVGNRRKRHGDLPVLEYPRIECDGLSMVLALEARGSDDRVALGLGLRDKGRHLACENVNRPGKVLMAQAEYQRTVCASLKVSTKVAVSVVRRLVAPASSQRKLSNMNTKVPKDLSELRVTSAICYVIVSLPF